jgi:hypothetical protein
MKIGQGPFQGGFLSSGGWVFAPPSRERHLNINGITGKTRQLFPCFLQINEELFSVDPSALASWMDVIVRKPSPTKARRDTGNKGWFLADVMSSLQCPCGDFEAHPGANFLCIWHSWMSFGGWAAAFKHWATVFELQGQMGWDVIISMWLRFPPKGT